MRNKREIAPVEESNREQLLDFIRRDKILHILTLYDLKSVTNKTRVWVASIDA